VERGFLGLRAVGNEAAEESDEESGDTAMTGVVKVRDALELVDNGFDHHPSAE
jgi:hypothetical protein